MDIVGPVNPITRWNGCIVGRNECSEIDPCLVRERWKAVKEAYLELLSGTTIAELAEQHGLLENGRTAIRVAQRNK